MPNQPSLSLNGWLGPVKPVSFVNLIATCAVMITANLATTRSHDPASWHRERLVASKLATRKTGSQQAGSQKSW